MENTYISNLNASGKADAYAESKKSRFSKLMAEAVSVLANEGALLMAWNDNSSMPSSVWDYRHLMMNPVSEYMSSSVTISNIAGGQAQVVLPVKEADKQKFDYENAKAAIVFGAQAFDIATGQIDSPAPLVLIIVGFDQASSNHICKPVNGRKISASDEVALMPPIPINSKVVFLSEIPDITKEIVPANGYILDTDCPLLREDAKRGDVFVYYPDCSVSCMPAFIKCYTYEEKIAALMRQPKKVLLSPDGKNRCHAYLAKSSDVEASMEDKVESCYILLTEDVIKTKVTEAASSSSSSSGSETSGSSGASTVTSYVEYEKGTFLFADMSTGDLTLTKVPFDIFYL